MGSGFAGDSVIAFMTRGVNTPVGFAMWSGIRAEVARQNARMLTFDCGLVGAEGTGMYHLIQNRLVDGAVSWATSDKDKGVKFYNEHFKDLPLVMMTMPVEPYPVVMIDMYPVMKRAMEHLIQVHGYRKIVFIRGSETNNYFEARFQAYRDALAEADIAFDPKLVTEPAKNTERLTGYEAVCEFLDKRGLKIGEDIEAFMGVTEAVTIGAVDELTARGYKAPEDYAYISYDNSLMGMAMRSKPSSQMMPFEGQGQTAVRLLYDLIHKETVPIETKLPASLEINRSCGCELYSFTQLVKQAGPTGHGHAEGKNKGKTGIRLLEEFTGKVRDSLRERQNSLGRECFFLQPELTDMLAMLCEAFVQAFVQDSPQSFQDCITSVVDEHGTDAVALDEIQDILTYLRNVSYQYPEHEIHRKSAESTVAWGRLLVSQHMVHIEREALFRLDDSFANLRGVIRGVASEFDMQRMFKQLDLWLPRLGIQNAAIVRFETLDRFEFLKPVPAQGSVIYALRDGKPSQVPKGGFAFKTRDLLPDHLFPRSSNWHLHVSPLVFMGLQIGYLVIENGPLNRLIYASLAEQLSSSLQAIILTEQREQAEKALAQTLQTVQAKAAVVSDASQNISAKVSDINNAMLEITHNISAILERTESVMAITNESVTMAEKATDQVSQLDGDSKKIGDITRLIEDITERTKVLSINASIEAARAREAGRGFAAVAREVKKLAEETNDSTAVINEMIERIQSGSAATKEVIRTMAEIISSIRTQYQKIEELVSQHVSATNDISNKLSDASRGSQEIYTAIAEVASLKTGL